MARETATGFMLHSDQSFPGTPDWPGSRTDTGPGRGRKNIRLATDLAKIVDGMKILMKAHLCLNGGRSLGAQHLDSLEDVHHSFIPHPLKHDTEGDEYTSPSYSSAVS